MSFEIGTLRFAAKTRVNGTGILYQPLFKKGGESQVVRSTKEYQTNMWAKVSTPEYKLVEIIGPVGDYTAENRAFQAYYGLTPCKYPEIDNHAFLVSQLAQLEEENREVVNGAITVDNSYTMDRDDAISFKEFQDSFEIGIHITDTTAVPQQLYTWAKNRVSSIYWYNEDGYQNSKPMLPPKFAHDYLSLNMGKECPCLSLFIKYDRKGKEAGRRFAWTRVNIANNLSYETFGDSTIYDSMRNALTTASKLIAPDPEALIEWAMLEYNRAFAKLVYEKKVHGALLRCQDNAEKPADYRLYDENKHQIHASIGGVYGHFTSPIRRFADMHNQMILKSIIGIQKSQPDYTYLTITDVQNINTRMDLIRAFHYAVSLSFLAYRCKSKSTTVKAMITLCDGGRVVTIEFNNQRFKVPIYDSYYTEGIEESVRDAPANTQFTIELFGIHKKDRGELRLRLIGWNRTQESIDMNGNLFGNAMGKKQYDDAEYVDIKRDNPEDSQEQYIKKIKDIDPYDPHERMKGLLGYELDGFQRSAMHAMLNSKDVLGMAPTGSGKTVLALLAVVLRAFDKGKRAILTTPIKALSNQKYAEFTTWLQKAYGKARVSLLTGDIQLRCTAPGGDGEPELIIMTTEILANKLEMQRSTEKDDPDMVGVSVVIMDEVHYINDLDRGHVWERTLMMLPTNVQLVALSATLSTPDTLCEWMSRRRPTELVIRRDRHVPLYFGGYGFETGLEPKFIQLHCTNKSTVADAGTFDSSKFDMMYGKIRYNATGNRTGSGIGDLHSSINRIVGLLERDDKLPAIIFMFSRGKCIDAARSITRNLLWGSRPQKRKGQHDLEFEGLSKEHEEEVKEIRKEQDIAFRRLLGPYIKVLETLPGFNEFIAMCERGVAYHHAGMLPLLREYVELLFQQKLLKVVFATETLGVGINMPARTVVFTGLEKPNGFQGVRLLRTDEFWQMAGRAGRRGMDTTGYVVYHPLMQPATYNDVRGLLLGSMPNVESKLRVNATFVLKSIDQGQDNGILGKTLLNFELKRRQEQIKSLLRDTIQPTEDRKNAVATYESLKLRLEERDFIKLTKSQRKDAETRLQNIRMAFPDIEDTCRAFREKTILEQELADCGTALPESWQINIGRLAAAGFLDESHERVTRKGRISARLFDCLPLVRGTVIAENGLPRNFESIVAWLACFCEQLRPYKNIQVPSPSREFQELVIKTMEAKDTLENNGLVDNQGEVYIETGCIIYLWATTKDIASVAELIDFGSLGSFVRVVLRVIAMVEELRSILLGLGDYETYNLLENPQERLLSGVVTNRSLYA